MFATAFKKLVNKFFLVNGKKIIDAPHACDDPVVFQLSLFDSCDLIIFDVGAAIGTVAKNYRRHLEARGQDMSSRIYCFEPLSLYFQKLQSGFSGIPGVICEQIALSDSKGFANFYHGSLPFVSSLLPLSNASRDGSWGKGVSLQTEKVASIPTTTIDAYCIQNSLQRINILKIDAQGGEARILRGAESLLSQSAIDLIYLEVIFDETYDGQPSLSDHLEMMSRYGYQLINIYDVTKVNGRLMQMDVLFASKVLLEDKGACL